MLKNLKLLLITSILFAPLYSHALHEPYIDNYYQGIVTAGIFAGEEVEIHLQGQTSNYFDGNDYTNEWSFTLDHGHISFNNPVIPFNIDLLSNFSTLDLTITQWDINYDESEGLDTGKPEHFIIDGILSSNSPVGSAPITISTVPIPPSLFLFATALAGLYRLKRHNNACKRDKVLRTSPRH